jgi:hypothetical protein
VTSARATGCEGSIQQSAGPTRMPCGSARIQEKSADMALEWRAIARGSTAVCRAAF